MYFWALDSNAGMGLLIYIILLETVYLSLSNRVPRAAVRKAIGYSCTVHGFQLFLRSRRGEQGFCSAECRCRHIAKEERREMEMLLRKRRDAFHRRHAAAAAPKMQASDRRITLQITAAR